MGPSPVYELIYETFYYFELLVLVVAGICTLVFLYRRPFPGIITVSGIFLFAMNRILVNQWFLKALPFLSSSNYFLACRALGVIGLILLLAGAVLSLALRSSGDSKQEVHKLTLDDFNKGWPLRYQIVRLSLVTIFILIGCLIWSLFERLRPEPLILLCCATLLAGLVLAISCVDSWRFLKGPQTALLALLAIFVIPGGLLFAILGLVITARNIERELIRHAKQA